MISIAGSMIVGVVYLAYFITFLFIFGNSYDYTHVPCKTFMSGIEDILAREGANYALEVCSLHDRNKMTPLVTATVELLRCRSKLDVRTIKMQPYLNEIDGALRYYRRPILHWLTHSSIFVLMCVPLHLDGMVTGWVVAPITVALVMMFSSIMATTYFRYNATRKLLDNRRAITELPNLIWAYTKA